MFRRTLFAQLQQSTCRDPNTCLVLRNMGMAHACLVSLAGANSWQPEAQYIIYHHHINPGHSVSIDTQQEINTLELRQQYLPHCCDWFDTKTVSTDI